MQCCQKESTKKKASFFPHCFSCVDPSAFKCECVTVVICMLWSRRHMNHHPVPLLRTSYTTTYYPCTKLLLKQETLFQTSGLMLLCFSILTFLNNSVNNIMTDSLAVSLRFCSLVMTQHSVYVWFDHGPHLHQEEAMESDQLWSCRVHSFRSRPDWHPNTFFMNMHLCWSLLRLDPNSAKYGQCLM